MRLTFSNISIHCYKKYLVRQKITLEVDWINLLNYKIKKLTSKSRAPKMVCAIRVLPSWTGRLPSRMKSLRHLSHSSLVPSIESPMGRTWILLPNWMSASLATETTSPLRTRKFDLKIRLSRSLKSVWSSSTIRVATVWLFLFPVSWKQQNVTFQQFEGI